VPWLFSITTSHLISHHFCGKICYQSFQALPDDIWKHVSQYVVLCRLTLSWKLAWSKTVLWSNPVWNLLLCCSPSCIPWRWRKCDHWWSLPAHRHLFFYLASLCAKTKTRHILVRELPFTHDPAFVSHSKTGLQWLMDRFASAYETFSLTISNKKMLQCANAVHWTCLMEVSSWRGRSSTKSTTVATWVLWCPTTALSRKKFSPESGKQLTTLEIKIRNEVILP